MELLISKITIGVTALKTYTENSRKNEVNPYV